jgi:hypothetical protein
VEDGLESHELERLRRSMAMLGPGQPVGLTREHAIRLLEELQRLHRSDPRYADLLARLKALRDDHGSQSRTAEKLR